MVKPKLLLIDDSEDIHLLVKRTVSDFCDVVSAYEFDEAIRLFENDTYAVVIIDLDLANKNGMDLLKEFKLTPMVTRFFIMTSKDSLQDELQGHTYGVHEYIKKPVNRDILKAIIQKNIKTFTKDSTSEIQVGPFHLFPEKYKALVRHESGEEEELQLTIKEFKVLVKLVSHPEKPFTREDLFSQIWETDSESTFRTIDMHVSSLRKKLGPSGHFIKTVHQVGYKFTLV